MINDVSGGRLDPDIVRVAAETGAGIVLGHLRGAPATMMDDVAFRDVVDEVGARARPSGSRRRARPAATRPGSIPGSASASGWSTTSRCCARCRRCARASDVPLMVGVSRKAFIGQLTGKPAGERVFGTAAAVTAAVHGRRGAVRVHDVAEMRDVVRVRRSPEIHD